jgi:hypothetical protein
VREKVGAMPCEFAWLAKDATSFLAQNLPSAMEL